MLKVAWWDGRRFDGHPTAFIRYPAIRSPSNFMYWFTSSSPPKRGHSNR